MKVFVYIIVLALSTLANAEVTWTRTECAICGRTIWEKTEVTSDAFTYDAVAVNLATANLIWQNFVTDPNTPPRIEAETLDYRHVVQVCPVCNSRYAGSFRGTLKAAAEKFIADAVAKEGPRRAEAAKANAADDLRRVQVQLKEYQDTVLKLTKEIEALKKNLASKD